MPGVGTNRYSYSANDPVNLSDPNGNRIKEVEERDSDDDRGDDDEFEISATEVGKRLEEDTVFADDEQKREANGRKVVKTNKDGLATGGAVDVPGRLSGGGLARPVQQATVATGNKVAAPKPKPGDAGGPGAGKSFSAKTKNQALIDSNSKCVFCGRDTVKSKAPQPNRSHIDHSIPKSRGGNNTINNAQNTCQTCNLEKRTMTSQEFTKFRGK